jgi:hypothetical protein
MGDKRHVIANVFIYHKDLLKQYQDVLKPGLETEQHFSLLCWDGELFAAIELRPLSVAWFINTSRIPDYHHSKKIAGALDKEGWLHLSTNKGIYLEKIKELLQLRFIVNHPPSL